VVVVLRTALDYTCGPVGKTFEVKNVYMGKDPSTGVQTDRAKASNGTIDYFKWDPDGEAAQRVVLCLLGRDQQGQDSSGCELGHPQSLQEEMALQLFRQSAHAW
jgi:hypothetical protein